MASKSTDLAARREALVARCADQRALVAQEVAMLSSPQTLGLIPAYAARHRKTALIVAGVAAAARAMLDLPFLTFGLHPVGLAVSVAVGVAVTVVAALVLLARRVDQVLPWVLAAPLLAVGAAYAVRPRGDPDGWAGTWAWPVYLALVPVVGAVVLAAEPRGRRDRGRRAFRRSVGRSTSR